MKGKILRFEITDRCNQKCKMCWSTKWQHRDMSYENIEKMVLEYNEKFPNGTIVLTSREPLLSPSFEKFLELTKKLNIKVKLLTNGTLFDDKNCKLIVESTIDFISLSIHGNEEQHNKVVNVPNSYQKILEGIKRINKYKEKYNREDLDIRITTVINNQTYDNIDGIIEVCKNNKLNLRIQHLMWHSSKVKEKNKKVLKELFDYDDYCIDGFLDYPNVTAEYVNKTIEKARKLCSENNIDLQIYPNLDEDKVNDWYSNDKEINNMGYCDHVSESIRVRANGDISLCQYIDRYYGNVMIDGFDRLIDSDEYKTVSENLIKGKLFPICNHCCHLRTNVVETSKNKKI